MTVILDTAPWWATLSAGHLVAFIFPSAEGDAALEKARPALILSVDRNGDELVATVAYGTTRSTRANVGRELHVRSENDRATAGLHRPTRFVGARIVRVPLSSPRFVLSRSGSAILGRLPEHLHPRLADIAAQAGRVPLGRRRRGLRRPRRDGQTGLTEHLRPRSCPQAELPRQAE